MANSAFKDPETIDEKLKELILGVDCPADIRKLAFDRPSVFDILCSHYRYRPALIKVQRNLLRSVRSGQLSSQQGYYEYFRKIHPNSDTIIRDLQKEALCNQAAEAKDTGPNLQ